MLQSGGDKRTFLSLNKMLVVSSSFAFKIIKHYFERPLGHRNKYKYQIKLFMAGCLTHLLHQIVKLSSTLPKSQLPFKILKYSSNFSILRPSPTEMPEYCLGGIGLKYNSPHKLGSFIRLS